MNYLPNEFPLNIPFYSEIHHIMVVKCVANAVSCWLQFPIKATCFYCMTDFIYSVNGHRITDLFLHVIGWDLCIRIPMSNQNIVSRKTVPTNHHGQYKHLWYFLCNGSYYAWSYVTFFLSAHNYIQKAQQLSHTCYRKVP